MLFRSGMEINNLAAKNSSKAKRRLSRYRRLLNSRPLIAISDGMVSDLRENILISSRIEKITNPFDFDSIKIAADSSEVKTPEGKYVIHVGRFHKQKRHDLLLKAWAQTRTEHLLVLLVEDSPELRKLISAYNQENRVVIAGFQKNPYPWMAKAELLVLSSDVEGLSNVIIESLICGTPVVSTNCPSGPSEILCNLPESLVSCDDASALARAIENHLNSPPNLSKVNISRFLLATVLDAYEALGMENVSSKKVEVGIT